MKRIRINSWKNFDVYDAMRARIRTAIVCLLEGELGPEDHWAALVAPELVRVAWTPEHPGAEIPGPIRVRFKVVEWRWPYLLIELVACDWGHSAIVWRDAERGQDDQGDQGSGRGRTPSRSRSPRRRR